MSRFGNLGKGAGEGVGKAADDAARVARLEEQLLGKMVLPDSVKAEKAAEKQATEHARQLKRAQDKEDVKTSGAQERARIHVETAERSSQARQNAAYAEASAAEHTAHVKVNAEKKSARAQYDSYIEHKKAEHDALPPQPQPVTAIDKLDAAGVTHNLHLTPAEYRVLLGDLKQELRQSGQLVDRRTWTKDIKVEKSGDRDIRSIEHMLREGKKITAGEFERLTTAWTKKLSHAQTDEMKLLKGSLEEPHMQASIPQTVSPSIGVAPGLGGAISSIGPAIINRIPRLPQREFLSPGLRYVPFNPTPGTATLLTAMLLTGTADITTDKDHILGPTARFLDKVTDGLAADITMTDPKTGKIAEFDVGLYRSLLMTNRIIQDPERRASFAKSIGSADPGLTGIYLDLVKQHGHAQSTKAFNIGAQASVKEAEAIEAKQTAGAQIQKAQETYRSTNENILKLDFE